jgi:cytoskeletal protein CcmA (bactofilin family)
MFASKRQSTVIAEGLKIVGSVTAEGLVEVNGQIEGELHCASLVISRQAHITGAVTADHVVVDGKVEGPIQGGDVLLKSKAHVVGDIQHQSLAIERGAFFDGRSVHTGGAGARQALNGKAAERAAVKPLRDGAHKGADARPAA